MIRADGWDTYSIWEHSSTVQDLYRRRCRLEAEEMTCAGQAAELLRPHIEKGDSLLDVGCGSGYFYHSLAKREIPVEYFGIDAASTLVGIGREEMPPHGLPPDRIMHLRIEDLAARVDHVVCMNVLSNIDNYHRPLERILHSARKTVILRESIGAKSAYSYVRDAYLDEGVDLNVYVNTYAQAEVRSFIQEHGFDVRIVMDRRTMGDAEMVIGHPHFWTFVVASNPHSVA